MKSLNLRFPTKQIRVESFFQVHICIYTKYRSMQIDTDRSRFKYI